jgi:hypothetical protein
VLAPEEDFHSLTAHSKNLRQTMIRYTEEAKFFLQLTLFSLTTFYIKTLAKNGGITSFHPFLTLLEKIIPNSKFPGKGKTDNQIIIKYLQPHHIGATADNGTLLPDFTA